MTKTQEDAYEKSTDGFVCSALDGCLCAHICDFCQQGSCGCVDPMEEDDD